MACNPESVIGQLAAKNIYSEDDFIIKHWATELGLTVPMFRSLPPDIQERLKRIAVKKNTECQTYNAQMCQFEEEERLGYDFDNLDQLEEDVNRRIDVSPKQYHKPRSIMCNKENCKTRKDRRNRIRIDSGSPERHRYIPGSRWRPPCEPELPFIDKRPMPLIYFNGDMLPKDYHYTSAKVPTKILPLPDQWTSGEPTGWDEEYKSLKKKESLQRKCKPRICTPPPIIEEKKESCEEKLGNLGPSEISWYHQARAARKRRFSAPGRIEIETKRDGNEISWYHAGNTCGHYSDDDEYY